MASTRLDLVLMKLPGYGWYSPCTFSKRLDKSTMIQLGELQMELRFLKMLFWCYENCDYTGNINMDSDSFMSEFEVPAPEMAVDIEQWDGFANQLMEKVEHFKPQIKEICFDLLSCSLLNSKSSTFIEFNDFIATILQNLEDLLGLKSQMIVSVKDQIEVLQQKLKLLEKLSEEYSLFRYLSSHSRSPGDRNFLNELQAWTIKVASLSFLYWVDNLEGETLAKLNTMCLDVLQQLKPRTPEALRMFLVELIEASKLLQSNSLLMGELVASSVDMLLEDLIASMEESSKTLLRDGLIISITFLADPPYTGCGRDGNDIWEKADAFFDEAATFISSLSCSKEKDCNPDERDFLKKIGILKEEIKENYVQIPDFSWPEFPRTNGLGFLDFLSENLKEKTSSLPFAKCLLLALRQKLISIRPFLKYVMEQQNEFEEARDLWLQILGVAYAVEHFVDSCFFVGNQIWHRMICLCIFLEKIEFLITEAEKIRDESMFKSRVASVELNPSQMIPIYDQTSRFEEVIVGFKNEAEAIFDQLTGGSAELEIVSIVGMAGQGKTTLANKVYNDPSIKNHFHKLAWCFVSQVYELKMLLLDILRGVTGLNRGQIHEMSEGELAEKLFRCLKGHRYLIVLDDIWDIKAWHQLRESFPNDENGSRIMITSRDQSMASQTNLGSSTHRLCPLSAEESWELLQRKLFHEDACPENLSDIGLQIVELCKGLPLSIVVIAGVLARRIRDLSWWKEIATNQSSKILGEQGCMNILDLSYKHLPEHLKPCFLYFGAFQQGKAVRVRKLIHLWVAEGFIPKVGTKKQEDLAEDFLMDLILRSLVIVVERRSNSGIKKCRIHDLLFDFCLAKIEEERFLCSLNDPQCPSNNMYEQHRLSIHTELKIIFESKRTALHARTLLLGTRFELFSCNAYHSKFLLKFKFLRVLDLYYGARFYEFTFPSEISSLIHLRYLALGGQFRGLEIPCLLNLEVLRLRSVYGFILPPTIWKMKRLRHILLRSFAYFTIANSLHRFEGGTLDNVDTLSYPMLCRNEYSEELLGRFPKIRKLRFELSDFDSDSPQFPVLDFLSNLESLNVSCLGKMDYSCGFQLPSTLKKLTLSGSGLPWSEISAIAKLPNLEVLKLLRAFVGRTWDMEEGFMKLRFLKLNGLDIKRWKACSDPFPCLERLVLEYCNELEEIPSDFGEISTLDQIEVRYCSKGAQSSAREILNVQRECGNDGFAVLIMTDNCGNGDLFSTARLFEHIGMLLKNYK